MDMGKFLRCALCGYTLASEEPPKVAIRFEDTDQTKSKEAKAKIFQVLPSGLSSASSLESDSVYLVADPSKNTIWLWKGKSARPGDVYNAGTAATKLKAAEKIYSAKLVRVEEGDEPPEFPEIGAMSKEMVSEAKEALDIKLPEEGQHNIYLINKGELEKIPKPVFTTGDSYLIDAGDKIWVWIGAEASVDEKFSAAHLSTVIDVARRGKPKITTVDQGKEPKDLRVELGGLKIVDKDLAETLLKHVEKEVWDPVLYRISSEEVDTIEDIVYMQVPCNKDSLDSEDVFLLDDRTNNRTYIWIGSKATTREKVRGGQVARKFEVERAGVQEEIFVDEGEEPEEFKRLLKMD